MRLESCRNLGESSGDWEVLCFKCVWFSDLAVAHTHILVGQKDYISSVKTRLLEIGIGLSREFLKTSQINLKLICKTRQRAAC